MCVSARLCGVRGCAEFIERVPLSLPPPPPPPSSPPPPLQPRQQQPGWSPSLSTLVSCCLAANNRRCLQSNLPLPWPMGAGALFHQTSLFRICREANFSKCYRYGSPELDLTRTAQDTGCYYYYYYYYYQAATTPL